MRDLGPSPLPDSQRRIAWPVLAGMLGLCFCGFACTSDPGQEPSTGRPNVLLIVVDTLRADRLSSYGYERPTSPVMDALAARGTRASDVTAQASWTQPSMVSMMQGRYVTSYRDVFFDDGPTLAEVFKGSGYRTLGVVGNGLLSQEDEFDRGFDQYSSRSKKIGQNGRTRPAREAAELVGDAADPLSRITEPEKDGSLPPFFAYLHFMDPHGPYQPNPRFDEQLPVAPADWDFKRQRELFASRYNGELGAPGEWETMGHHNACYDQEVRTVDEFIGIVLDFLDRQGVLENTIVAVVSDHGEGLYDHESPPGPAANPATPTQHFFRQHGKVQYEELIATPMILKGPGIPEGFVIDGPVENIDLFPTLLELCKCELPEGLHGQSLVPSFTEEGIDRDKVYSSILESRSVREATSGWKLIAPTHYFPARDVELFNLIDDPMERHDVAQSQPQVVERLQQALELFLLEYPTESNLGRESSEQRKGDLEGLGYGGGAGTADESECSCAQDGICTCGDQKCECSPRAESDRGGQE